MTETSVSHAWTAPDWRRQVDSWVRATCPDIETGGVVRERPWSATIGYDSASGPLWFKANGPGTMHEPTLLALLSRLTPDLVPEVLAIDDDRGWSLARDAGPTLRSVRAGTVLTPWESLLPRYAEAQLTLAARLPELLATGTADRRPTRLPALLAEVVEHLAQRPVDEGGLGAERRRALESTYPAYATWCAELAAAGVPDTLQHDDLHSANVCWPGSAAAQARIIDWGDASVMHPFATMLVTLGSIAQAAGLDLEDPGVGRVRDAYLEPFAAFGTRAERAHLVELATRTGVVARALSWEDALLGAGPEAQAAWEFPAREWLAELVAA